MRGMAQAPEGDMHSDFQPQVKSTPAASATEQIQQDINHHKVFVYMKVWHQRIHVQFGRELALQQRQNASWLCALTGQP